MRRRVPLVDLDALGMFFLAHANAGRLRQMFGPEWEPVALEAWEAHGAAITGRWIADAPCSRPSLWWALNAEEERPIVHPAPPHIEAVWREQHMLFGRLVCSILHGHGSPGQLVPWLEPERSFLERHDLLTSSERTSYRRQPAVFGDDHE
jgi:hypothetical protein